LSDLEELKRLLAMLNPEPRHLQALQNAVPRLMEELEAARVDAARYRWLRNQDAAFFVRFRADDGLECDLYGHDLDAAIDAARKDSND
jgi:hypothetical protein